MLNIFTTIRAVFQRECAFTGVLLLPSTRMNPWWFHKRCDHHLPKGIHPCVLQTHITVRLAGGVEVA
jgi:hypothetical protein